jgi:bifunctional NMN adenylyltransferase/nudix hydrolase
MKKLFIYIGRFQPFHNGHRAVLNKIIENYSEEGDAFMFIVGSADQQNTIRNPLSVEQRLQIIDKEASVIIPNKYTYITDQINDSPYNYDLWIAELQRKINKQINNNYKSYSPILIGNENVAQYGIRGGFRYIIIQMQGETHGTLIRDNVRENGLSGINEYVSNESMGLLEKFDFEGIVKSAFKRAEDYSIDTRSKYNSCYLTVDNIVIDGGKILLIKRKDDGLYALPGGFMEPNETSIEAAKRELKEETSLEIGKNFLLEKGPIVFDQPFRDPRSSSHINLVTHAYVWRRDIDYKSYYQDIFYFPAQAVSGDDANSVEWVSFTDIVALKPSMFHADHKKIICNIMGLSYFES